MFNKKASSCQFFETYEVPFVDFGTFCRDNTDSGDWIVSLSGNLTKTRGIGYDDRLLRLFRHQDTDLVMKDISKMGTMQRNFLECVKFFLVDKIGKFLETINKKTGEEFVAKLQSMYDDRMMGNDRVNETFVWIPIHAAESETCFVVKVIDRIVLVFT